MTHTSSLQLRIHCPVTTAATSPHAACRSDAIAEPSGYFRFKPALDRLLTIALMAVALPVILIVAVIALICEGRPVFYRQLRVGKDGRAFKIWKFRTMRRDAERRTGAVWSTAGDSRVTTIGRWLRCSHLDELPQLFNVLAGEMSLMGPRPERPEFVEPLSMEVPNYLERTRVRPGITGLAQIHLGYDESLAGIPQKVNFDLQYIRTASLYSDLTLLAATIPYILCQLHHKWSVHRHSKPKRTRPFQRSVSIIPPRVFTTPFIEEDVA